MKCLIMAAGLGVRMNGSTMGRSKTILPIDRGLPLLRQTVETLKSLGLDEVVVVVGHDRENVARTLSETGATIVENNQYNKTNSIVSAYKCMSYFDGSDDILMMNGDSYYETPLIRTLLDDPGSPILLVDRDRRHQADVKVVIEDDHVIRYGKQLHQQHDAESADLVKLSASHAWEYGQALIASIRQGEVDCYWEDVLFRMTSVRVVARETAGVFWTDVDRFEDYERLLLHINGVQFTG